MYFFHDLVSIRDRGRYSYRVTKLFGGVKPRHITDRIDKGFHSFRVLMVTILLPAEVSELEAAYLLGHSKGT